MSNHTIQQHLIDPEICIRCNTCEATCPVGAITHDSRNYVVDVDKCNHCMACVPPCPTGSIDNWRTVVKLKAYSLDEQLGWDELPAALDSSALQADATDVKASESEDFKENRPSVPDFIDSVAIEKIAFEQVAPAIPVGSNTPPWSAAHPYVNLYGPKSTQHSAKATCVGNVRVTALGTDYDTHHIVLDFGTQTLPLLEGQSIGIIPPGADERGKPHHARQYSIASPRNGERPGYNNCGLTVKRVLEDHSGQPVRGVASNFVCDLQVGDTVDVIGPFGSSFLMPNHPGSHIVMICTGTGSAPMRAMTEWRRRQLKAWAANEPSTPSLTLFFGARTEQELPYFGPLQSLPKNFINTHFAYSRTPGQPKRYVQDAMREQAQALAALLKGEDVYFYVCGLKAMEAGVLHALQDICEGAGLNWAEVSARLKRESRLHLETY